MKRTVNDVQNRAEFALLRDGAVAMESLYSELLSFAFSLDQLQRLEPAVVWVEGATPPVCPNGLAVERTASTYVLRTRTASGEVLTWRRSSTVSGAQAAMVSR